MGYSSVFAAAVLVAFTLTAAVSLMRSHSDQSAADAAMRDREEIAGDASRSSISYVGFNCTNVTASVINVTLYAGNVGSARDSPGCVDLYLDGVLVSHSGLSFSVYPALSNSLVWGPTQTLAVTMLQEIDVGEHNVTLVSCLGARAEGRFNASKCGDGRCEGGEYCPLDNSSCAKIACLAPYCMNGCQNQPIVNGIDPGFCDSNNKAGECLTSPCECGPAGVCCGLPGAACSVDGNCCPGFGCAEGKCVSG